MITLDKLESHKKRLIELAKEKPAFNSWIKQVNEMEQIVIVANNMLQLKRDPVIKDLLKVFKANNEKINQRLTIERGLSQAERDLLFIQKDWNQQFLDLFKGKQALIKSSEKRINDCINNLEKNGY